MKSLVPSVPLGSITLEQWETLRKLATTEGTPYIDREHCIAIDLRDKRHHWIYAICRYYKKGQYDLTLRAVPNPLKRIEKLRVIKPKEQTWAREQAEKLLEKLHGPTSQEIRA